ncbi:unnamed protein product [Darwinula stevensoni]|uniref:Ribosome biogenesis protein BOP1 homolog n=1 Tax=Darwinula stevensoni TaxID=69355 RepID=A0A7R8X979_9CRUS|nr:unnamed protein product [Darwinula stevensoni]CAG0888891.1 unnamed protein product [Darwinula stevensoni]
MEVLIILEYDSHHLRTAFAGIPGHHGFPVGAMRLESGEEGEGGECPQGTATDVRTNVDDEKGEGEVVKPSATIDEFDSSDEEDLRNTVGNIPMEYYQHFVHIGYDLDGKKIIKPKKKDELDHFLQMMEDPEFWRTVEDKSTGQDVRLSEADVRAIHRMQKNKIPDETYNPYEPWVDFFTNKVMQTSVTAHPPHKRSFIPSLIERQKVGKMVHAIKMGWMKPQSDKKEAVEKYGPVMVWDSNSHAEEMRRIHNHIPAPKLKLPVHAESYNPPPEYLFDEDEMKKWESLEEEPWRRKYDFVPQKYSSLRQVPSYDRFIKERFERCLDLYLAPRARRMRLTIQPEDLVPQLPKPQELHPFPVVQSLVYEGHSNMVRSVSVEPLGQFLASGSDDGTVRVWEIQTGRCLKVFEMGGVVKCVAWCPNTSVCLLAITVDNDCVILNPGVGDKLVVSDTDHLVGIGTAPDQGEYLVPERIQAVVKWESPSDEQRDVGYRVIIKHFKPVRQVSWHGKGDYFATVMPEGLNRAVLIHQLSKWRSQLPFQKAKGLVQCILFHPIRPYLFVATQRYVRVYNLVKQELTKKLLTGVKWISSMAVHPGGDNIVVGTYDSRSLWFDLDLSTKPYKVLRHHRKAVRSVAFHRKYPLFATCSDDGAVIICHGMVYSDLLQNPLIVPVKILRGHTLYDDFSVLDCCFHPIQPWIFSSGADFTIRLFT